MQIRRLKVSLQTKILAQNILLILIIILVLSASFTYLVWKQTEEQMGKRALEVSQTVASMPAIREAFQLDYPASVIQPLVEKIRREVGAEFIVVGNKNGIRYSHPVPERIGHKMVGGDNAGALLYGKSYVSKAVGTLGPSLRGKTPIFDKNGHVIGIVSVGYLINDIQYKIFQRILVIVLFSLFVLGLGFIGSILLAKNIRRDTLGLEPHEIAALYGERGAVLLSIKEGILSIDDEGYITMINTSGMQLLGVEEDAIGKKIEEVLPNTQMYDVLKSGKVQKDQELTLGHHIVIVNQTPVYEQGNVIGVVASFRDKTEIQEMVNTLSEVRKYSEDLRAQTHEYTNKLYVLSGLMQLGQYDEAIQMIQKEAALHESQNRILFDLILDKKVQAILLGKLGKASEKKIQFKIDENSSIDPLPSHIELSQLITILGNLIDNAFDAVSASDLPEVTFFALDMGEDVIFEIVDNGPGITDHDFDQIFEKGVSTKGAPNHGYGLANVKEVVDKLDGMIEMTRPIQQSGMIFTVYLPKGSKGE